MSNINALRQKRAAALTSARKLNDIATAAGRDLTAAEARQFEARMDEYQNLGKQIDRMEVLEREALHLAETTNEQVDQNSDWHLESRSSSTKAAARTSFTDQASGREFRCYDSKEPIADVRSESALDFARVIVERCSGQKLLSAERRAAQVDSDVSGGYLVNSSSAFGIFELARAKTAVARAGAKTLPIRGTDSVNLAVVEADPTFSWTRELESFDLDAATAFGTRKLQARKLITQIELSYEFFRTVNGPQVILDLLTNAYSAEIDRASLAGDAAVSGGAVPTGILNVSGISTVAATGGTLTLDQLLDVLGALQSSNVEPNALILSPQVNTLLSKIKDGDGRYFNELPSDLATLTKIVSSKMPSTTAIMGDFQSLLLCPFGEMEISVTKDVGSRRGSYLVEIHSFFDCAPIFASHFNAITAISS